MVTSMDRNRDHKEAAALNKLLVPDGPSHKGKPGFVKGALPLTGGAGAKPPRHPHLRQTGPKKPNSPHPLQSTLSLRCNQPACPDRKSIAIFDHHLTNQSTPVNPGKAPPPPPTQARPTRPPHPVHPVTPVKKSNSPHLAKSYPLASIPSISRSPPSRTSHPPPTA